MGQVIESHPEMPLLDETTDSYRRWMLRLALRLTSRKPRFFISDAVLRALECTPGRVHPIRKPIRILVDVVSLPFGGWRSDSLAQAEDLLARNITLLDGNDRRLVAMRYYRRLSFLALARETGLLSYRSSRRRVHRAEESLQRFLVREAGPDWRTELRPLRVHARAKLIAVFALVVACSEYWLASR
ncbi:MAG: hypothetical protein ACI841_000116 [Planctomycetota bacterium]